MKKTVNEWLNYQDNLKRILSEKLPGDSALAFSITLHGIVDKLKPFEQKREELVKQFGEEDKGVYRIPPEKQADYFSELKPLTEVEVEIDIQKIKREFVLKMTSVAGHPISEIVELIE